MLRRGWQVVRDAEDRFYQRLETSVGAWALIIAVFVVFWHLLFNVR